MKQNKSKGKRKAYVRGFSIAFAILLFGIILEWFAKGNGIALPAWPMNLFVGLSFAFCLVFIHVFYRDIPFVKWMSQVPASISSIALFTFLTLLMGLTTQNNPDAAEWMKATGFHHVRNSYSFLLSGLYLLATLGLVILRRFNKLTYRNVGFLLNHLGLWIIVLAGSLGAGDLKRVSVSINENETVWFGYENGRTPRELPFTLKLLDFDIEFFSPKIAYFQTETMALPDDIENNLTMIREGLEVDISGWKIKVNEFEPRALLDSLNSIIPSTDTLAVPYAKVSAIHSSSGTRKEGVITSGGIKTRPMFLTLNERFSLGMTIPEPKVYSSLLEIMDSRGNIDTSLLVVNEPIKVDGWNIYQQSYDQRFGKWSRNSGLEAVNDPWLPIIYLGIFMVIAGSLYLFTIGKTPKEETNERN